jgi:hypothetical protein
MNMESAFPTIPNLVTIAGLFLIIVSLVTIRWKEQEAEAKNAKLAFGVGVLLFISGIILASTGITGPYAPPPTPTPTPTPTPVDIKITYPLDSTTVQMKENITGTAINIPDGQQLWIAIYPQNANKYYPQNPVDVQNDGSWTLPVQFGQPENVGVKYDLYAVLADKNAQKEFNDYLDNCIKTNSWPGMRELPNGTSQIIKLTVIRASSADIKITYPSDSATVQMKENITGTAINIPDGQQLWIAIYPQNAYKYYPQNPVDVQNDGSWTLPVQFGQPENVGVKYDLYAVLADKNAQKEFNDYFDNCIKTNSWPGMGELPDGTTQSIKLTVTRV